MKKIYKFLLVFFLTFISSNLFSQFAEPVTRFPFINGPSTDVYPQCASGLIYDDNTWENGYGWNTTVTDGRIIQKFTPLSYPYYINQVCFAMTRLSSASAYWTFDLLVYDTTGTAGSPGNLVAAIANLTASNVPIWPNTAWFDFVSLTVPQLTSGSYYIGLKTNFQTLPSHYLCADENSTTPIRPVYAQTNGGAWVPMTAYFQSCKAVGIRVEGNNQLLAHDVSVGPFLSLPAEYFSGNNYTIKAKISNLGTSNETAIPIKLLVDGVQYGSTVNINLSSGSIDSAAFNWTAVTGNHVLKIVSSLSTDQNRNNDTITTSIYVLPSMPPGYVYNACRHGLYKPIPDNGNAYDSIVITTIPSIACYVLDVNVRIDTVVHTWDSDLKFYIKHHGVEVLFIDRAGGSGDNFIGTNLNDSASISINAGNAPFTGTYRPSNPLSLLNGYVNYAGGAWHLRISDDIGGDTGFLRAWCITVTYYICAGGIQTITIPNYYALKQNYPNPFNPSTKIEYYIPKPGNVSLVVYDITGREVSELVNEYKNPGIYTIDFDGSGLSSGVYFYKMKAGDYTDTKKMLMVK